MYSATRLAAHSRPAGVPMLVVDHIIKSTGPVFPEGPEQVNVGHLMSLGYLLDSVGQMPD